MLNAHLFFLKKKRFVRSSQKSYETCFMKFHPKFIHYMTIDHVWNKAQCIFNYPHFDPSIFCASIISALLYIDYTFLCESKDFKVAREQSFMLFSLYVKKLLSNDESSTWNGILVIFISSNNVRPRWKFNQSHTVSLYLVSLLFTQLLTSSANMLFCTMLSS